LPSLSTPRTCWQSFADSVGQITMRESQPAKLQMSSRGTG
jgi:hypothetical protein